MGRLLAACRQSRESSSQSLAGANPPRLRKAAVQGGVGDPHDSAQAAQGLLINFVPAEQVGVIAKIPEEPAELPQGFGCAVEPTGEGTALMFAWFEDSKRKSEERSSAGCQR